MGPFNGLEAAFLLLVGVFALCLFGMFVITPISFWFTFRQFSEPLRISLKVGDERIPRDALVHFKEVIDSLQPLGFEIVGSFLVPEQVPKVKAFVLGLANRSSKDFASASVIYLDRGTLRRPLLVAAFVEFISRFRDGSVVQTSNTAETSAFPPRPEFSTIRFPMVNNAVKLFRLHEALVERHGSKSSKFLRLDEEFHGDAGRYLARAGFAEEYEAQIATGYLYLSQEGRVYRPTLKGAFLMAWAAVWPITSIRKMLQWRKGERILSDLEAQGVGCTLLERDDRPRILCPAYVAVSDDGINLRIAWRWLPLHGAFRVATMCVGWNSFLVFWYWLAIRADDPRWTWLAIIFSLGHLWIGLLLIYGTLVGLLARKEIMVTSDLLTVRTSPLPLGRNRELRVDEIEQMCCQREPPSNDGKASNRYRVSAWTKKERMIALVNRIDDLDLARFIERELTRWLKIEKRPFRSRLEA
jgi:hypothetical protein